MRSIAKKINYLIKENREEEIMEMTKNAMLQSYAIEFINAQMKLLEHVISERV